MSKPKMVGVGLPGMIPAQMSTGPKPLSRIMFDKYDKDHGGTIDAKEFRLLCYDFGYFLNEKEVAEAVSEIDNNGDGNISYTEFVAWWSKSDRFKNLHLDEDTLALRRQAAEIFQQFDNDKSGSIDVKEFAPFHQHLVKAGLTKKDEKKCLEDLDTDRDGSISFNEYIAYLQRIGSLPVKTLLASEFDSIVQTKKNLH